MENLDISFHIFIPMYIIHDRGQTRTWWPIVIQYALIFSLKTICKGYEIEEQHIKLFFLFRNGTLLPTS